MQIGALNSLAHTPAAKASGPAIPAPVMKKIDEASKSFESMFMSQMMQFMWAGDSQADETFGGGHGEEMWRGMLVQEFGKISAEGPGMGIAQDVRTQMIHMQQMQMAPQQTSDIEPTQTPLKESAQ